jgi:poly(3-hydroxybutyrate) depolymerase
MLLAILIAAGPARADRASIEPPCKGCEIALPEREGPVPLLVVMHGDHEKASKWLARWRGPALERGWGVLALQCPEDLGCSFSMWYRWNGDPKWVSHQVERLAVDVEIDRERTFLVAWSGGASYVGMHAPVWQRNFKALVIHGGGVPPRGGRCAARPLPVYFLVGDGNRFHKSAQQFRDYFTGCGSEVRWDLLEGADHAREDAALDAAKANAILDWLAERAAGPAIAGS